MAVIQLYSVLLHRTLGYFPPSITHLVLTVWVLSVVAKSYLQGSSSPLVECCSVDTEMIALFSTTVLIEVVKEYWSNVTWKHFSHSWNVRGLNSFWQNYTTRGEGGKKPNPGIKNHCSLIVFMSLLYFVGGPKTSNLIVVPMVQVPC